MQAKLGVRWVWVWGGQVGEGVQARLGVRWLWVWGGQVGGGVQARLGVCIVLQVVVTGAM